LKVLIISHMYPSSFNEVAGIFVHEQIKALVQKGIDVRVISPVPWVPFPLDRISRKWKNYHDIPNKANLNGIDVWYPRTLSFPHALFFASSGWRMYWGIRRIVATIYDEFRFDLIHAHTALPDGFAALKLKDKYNKPIVVTVHGQDLQHTIRQNAACRQTVSYVLNSASEIICVSWKLHNISLKYTSGRNRIAVASNGIDPQEWLARPVEYIKQQIDEIMLLSVSNLNQTKGIDLNLCAFQKLRKNYSALRYVVIGAGPEELSLRKLARKLGIEEQVVFLGHQPHSRVMDYMAACDVFTLPSWNEGFGIVYLEAMASCKPVIGCQGEGIEDFVEHGKTGMLVKPKDVDSLVDALDFLLSHPERAKAIGELARNHILENYTWEKNADKMIKVYEELCNVA
jgi:teichuronic acid biosynthesis glycosyltransferase TuaC